MPALDIENVWRTAPVMLLTVATLLQFILLYLSFAVGTTLLVERALPALQLGRVVDERQRPRGQRRREATMALLAMVAFAAWTPVVVLLDRSGVIHVVTGEGGVRVVGELLVLLAWNELHFWACHRLLHTRWLYKYVHAAHHRSRVSTPFTTFALHPVEAWMLGSVMVPVLLVVDVRLETLVLFPVLSLALNTVGHANYAVRGVLDGCARAHADHHRRARGGYGFALSAFSSSGARAERARPSR